MDKNPDYSSAFFEKIFMSFLDTLSAISPDIATPALSINNEGDGLFSVEIVLKVLDPQRSVDYGQIEEPS